MHSSRRRERIHPRVYRPCCTCVHVCVRALTSKAASRALLLPTPPYRMCITRATRCSRVGSSAFVCCNLRYSAYALRCESRVNGNLQYECGRARVVK